ncbi:MAG: hypothetical protein ACLFSQ_03830 [Candidatus Zixiibacteriota bacterium]
MDYIKEAEKSLIVWNKALAEVEKQDSLSEAKRRELIQHKKNAMDALRHVPDKETSQFIKLRHEISSANNRMAGALNDPK